MNLELLRAEPPGLEFEFTAETVRGIHQGSLQAGPAAMLQLLERKPEGPQAN